MREPDCIQRTLQASAALPVAFAAYGLWKKHSWLEVAGLAAVGGVIGVVGWFALTDKICSRGTQP